jgi:hypothetical protein
MGYHIPEKSNTTHVIRIELFEINIKFSGLLQLTVDQSARVV